jgi:hypothetical protein
MRKLIGALAVAGLLAGPASAGEAGDILRKNLEAGTIQPGGNAIEALMREKGETPESYFAIGMLEFVRGIEELAQALYLHGLAAPETGAMVPALTVPVPRNPDPETLDYDGVRLMLLRLQRQMDEAAEALLMAGRAEGEGADFVVPLDPAAIRIDLDGDGAGDSGEAVAAIIARAFGEDETLFSSDGAVTPPAITTPPPAGRPGAEARSRSAPRPPVRSETTPVGITIGFDRADAIWLAGYANVIAAQADFLLAHDFSQLVEVSFHRLFPRAGLPMQDVPDAGLGIIDAASDSAIADAIAAIHALNWPVVEPDRLKRVLERAKTVTQLSRENWQAILAETDDFAELVPSPRQSQSMGEDMPVTEAVIAAWMATLDTVEAVLDGELLLPHWRFKQGFDLKAYFETATRTDFVLIGTGHGARPFLRDGPIADAESFSALNAVMGDDWLGYAFWFN